MVEVPWSFLLDLKYKLLNARMYTGALADNVESTMRKAYNSDAYVALAERSFIESLDECVAKLDQFLHANGKD